MIDVIPTYTAILAEYYPNVQASANGSTYDDLQLLPGSQPLPSKDELDAKVASETIEQMWNAIKAERDDRTQNGGSHVGTYWFHSDQPSRTQQIALVILGANLPSGIMWKTMSGAFVPMTPTLAQQIFGAAVQLDQAVFAAAETHRARMAASPTPWSYDFSGGWPKTYEEAKALGETP